MGKNLIIKGADFSENAVILPENVQLPLVATEFATASPVTEGVTKYSEITWIHQNEWMHREVAIDVQNYNYTSKEFKQTMGTASLLNIYIADSEGVIIKKLTGTGSGSNIVIPGIEINSTTYPNAATIGFSTNIASTLNPVLIRERKQIG